MLMVNFLWLVIDVTPRSSCWPLGMYKKTSGGMEMDGRAFVKCLKDRSPFLDQQPVSNKQPGIVEPKQVGNMDKR